MTRKLEQQQQVIRQLTDENETLYQQYNHLLVRNNKLLKRIDDQQQLIDDLHLRMEELQMITSNQLHINDRLRQNGNPVMPVRTIAADRVNLDLLFEKWRVFPGQVAHNAPNHRKQVVVLATLYTLGSMSASDLFRECGIGGVTGARYVALLKKFGLVNYIGARKKGRYELTPAGIRFVSQGQVRMVTGDSKVPGIQQGIPTREDASIATAE
ncbi:MAG: hypothetical protein ACKOQ6_12625 [Bacteroidota bacterium]